MCGITGYIGCKNATPILIEGLRKLEYRGYDSSGITVIKNIVVRNTKNEYEIIEVSEFIDNDETLDMVMGY